MIKIKISKIHNKGVFAEKKIKKNTEIAFFEGHEISQNTACSLTLDGIRIEPTGKLKHLNHSCIPNSIFKGRWLKSLRDIMPDEEITIDYSSTEEIITHHFICNCRQKECRKNI